MSNTFNPDEPEVDDEDYCSECGRELEDEEKGTCVDCDWEKLLSNMLPSQKPKKS
jgi:NMD protein affecting ribosome stability and mRNA decay